MEQQSGSLRVALVHYWLVGMRGGEKVLEALCRMYPQADIFTHVLDRDSLSEELARHDIYTTFIDRLPAARRMYQKYLPLMPQALSRLNLLDYDLVISSESGPAKGVITRSDSLHLCYCHTPMRYLWDLYPEYYQRAGVLSRLGMRLFVPGLRRWDVESAGMVDAFVANSRTVARRIRKRWRREAAVVHPPVDIDAFPVREAPGGEYYLCMGQLVRYKRVDVAIEACARMGRKLVIVGGGEEMKRLKALAGPDVLFTGRADDAALAGWLRGARALLFPGEEDFGIVPVEALASGVPVLAYRRGGALETVRDGVGGLFFDQQTPEALMDCMAAFERREQDFAPQTLRACAADFNESRFRREFRHQVELAASAMRV